VAGVKPRIGLSAHPRMVDTSIGVMLCHTTTRLYVDAVVRAGGVPLVLPIIDPDDVGRVLDGLDGVVLTGGGDIDPARYGEEREPETNSVDPGRDAFDIALFEMAVERDIPVLAVCRGLQVMNVALGGTLVQHVPAVVGEEHVRIDRWDHSVHPVRLEPDSCVAKVMGAVEIMVNSTHHQAVDRPATGLRAVGWAADGTIEAVESTNGCRLLGVQWHPEMLETRADQQRLYRWVVDEASA